MASEPVAVAPACGANTEHLRDMLVEMALVVGRAVTAACTSFISGDLARAHAVVEGDRVVNAFEIEIDKAVVRKFAIDRPTGDELRLLLSIQKVNTSLERVGDHAVNIAEAAQGFWAATAVRDTLCMEEMAAAAGLMLESSLESFITGNARIAGEVLARDDVVDLLNERASSDVKLLVMAHKETFEAGLELLRAARNLERIADLATNIAEETIFCMQDRIVKHHADTGATAGAAEETGWARQWY